MRNTEIVVSKASSSGSRFCFICEERIKDRTVLIDFLSTVQEVQEETKEESSGESLHVVVERSCDQLCCHPKCAKNLVLSILDDATL